MKAIVSPEEYMALKDGAQQAASSNLDGSFNEGVWATVVRAVLGDTYVVPFNTIEIEVDWKRHGSSTITSNGKLAWSVIRHATKGECERCGGVVYS